MVLLPVSDAMLHKARSLYDFRARNSFTEMKSSVYGAVGELIVSQYYSVGLSNTKDYDIILEGYKCDIKTKRCTSPPKDYYLVSVASLSLHQNCDLYVFVRVLEDYSKAWILGYTSKENLLTNGVFKRKGELDVNGFTFVSDCYNLKISELWNV